MRRLQSLAKRLTTFWGSSGHLYSPRVVRLMLVAGAASICLGTFLKLTLELRENPEVLAWDRAMLLWIGDFRSDVLNKVALDLTALGSTTVLTLVSISSVVVLLLRGDKPNATQFFLIAVGAGIGSWLAKLLVARARPEVIPRLVEASGYSYPSGHSLAIAAIYCSIVLVACRSFPSFRARLVLVVLASLLILAVGMSRVYLGVHYPIDVASGMLLGIGWALLVSGIFTWHKRLPHVD